MANQIWTVIPDKVFDGHSIWSELLNDPNVSKRTTRQNVEDVLNAILRFKSVIILKEESNESR